MANEGWSKDQLRSYSFDVDQIPRLKVDDSRVDQLISNGQPVVITDSRLVESALKWNLDYLRCNIGDGTFNVYESPNHLFKYYDEKKLDKKLPGSNGPFRPPTKRLEMKFDEFYDLMKKPTERDKRIYLQQGLNDTVGQNIVRDFLQFNWKWVRGQQIRNNWGPQTSNLLLISQEGNVTPCHYDEQENFFAQVGGHKRVILFPPSQFDCLYPYPVYHPHDRQSQVNFENPDYKQFPKFRDVRGLESVVGPGDVLYLPSYWFHHFETLINGGTATSITFWYKAAAAEQIVRPFKPQQKMVIMRNIEKMVLEALGAEEELIPFMESLVLGRYSSDLRTVKS